MFFYATEINSFVEIVDAVVTSPVRVVVCESKNLRHFIFAIIFKPSYILILFGIRIP